MVNRTTHSYWQSETLWIAKNVSAWLTAAPLLLVAIYLYYTWTKGIQPSYLAKPPSKKTPIGQIHQLCVHPIKVSRNYGVFYDADPMIELCRLQIERS
jgi:hypothetical protein